MRILLHFLTQGHDQIFAGATCGGVIEQATHGAGQHVWDLDPNDTPSAIAWGRAAWYGILFYLITLCFSKISILLLYIHLFTFKWARLAGQILLGIVIITHLFMALATFTACIPLNSYWDLPWRKSTAMRRVFGGAIRGCIWVCCCLGFISRGDTANKGK